MKHLAKLTIITLIALYVEKGVGGEFEKQATALAKALSATKGIKKKSVSIASAKLDRAVASTDSVDVYAVKEGDSVERIAVVQKRIYEPNCTHTWVIGISPKKLKVDTIRVVEMSCPHAFPCKEKSFLEQYYGTGPADLKKLRGKVNTIAKATATSDFTTDAVVTAVTAAKIYMSEEG